MKGRISTVTVGLAAVAALIAVPAALATYTSPKLQVTQAGTTVTIKASVSPDDDPTASLRIFAPTGTQLTTNQAPGAVLGTAGANVKSLDFAGELFRLDGQLRVAGPPWQVSLAVQAACIGGVTPLATWVLLLTGAAREILALPAFLVPTSGAQAALGPAYIQVCLGPPDVPQGTPGRTDFGAKLYNVEAVINGVFSSVALGAWVSLWTPYTPLIGTVNVAGTVAAPAAIAPGAVSLSAKKSGAGAILSGRVTQAGQARGGATVTILGANKATGLKTVGRARVAANGAFTFRARTGTFFRARAVAAGAAAASLCSQIGPLLAPISCVNATVNGFTAQSKVVRKK